MIVNRCHVGDSYLSVVRYVLSRMNRGAFWKAPRADRRKFIKEVIRVHRENRKLYNAVVTGRF